MWVCNSLAKKWRVLNGSNLPNTDWFSPLVCLFSSWPHGCLSLTVLLERCLGSRWGSSVFTSAISYKLQPRYLLKKKQKPTGRYISLLPGLTLTIRCGGFTQFASHRTVPFVRGGFVARMAAPHHCNYKEKR